MLNATVRKDFRGLPDGSEEFTIHVTVGGEHFGARTIRNCHDQMLGGPPLYIIEREMRRNLMAEIERQIFKDN